MGTRIMQGGILVALLGIGGLLYSIRNQMTHPQSAAAPAEAAQTMPPGQALVPSAAAPAAAPAPQAAAPQPARQPAPAPRAAAPAGRQTVPRVAPPAPAPAYNPPAEWAATPPAYHPPPQTTVTTAPPATESVTVPAGTAIAIRLLDGISSDRNRAGDTFQATLEEPVVADGIVVAERGANAMGRVVQTQQAGRIAGLAELALELDRIHTVGGEVQIASDTMIRRGEPSRGKDAATVGAMAGIGAAIGAIAGGRKGAGIGAAAGGATGAGTVMATRGKPIQFEPETRLTFRLRAPITVMVDSSRARTVGYDEGRPRLQRRY